MWDENDVFIKNIQINNKIDNVVQTGVAAGASM